MRPFGAGQAIDQPFGAVVLVIAPDLIELLARVAYQFAGAADISEVLGKFRSRQLAPCSFTLAPPRSCQH